LGARLRQLRRARGLSQLHVAKACGLSRSYLCEIELERRSPPRPGHPLYARLGAILGVDVEELRREAVRHRLRLIEGISWRNFKLHHP
jgi:transcriptional regulator with XRE-family HTH domain